MHEMQAKIIAGCIKSALTHEVLLNIFKKVRTEKSYTLYNIGNRFSRTIDLNRYLSRGKKYLNIFKLINKCSLENRHA